MGIASLVLGIISIIIGFIPFCGAIAFLPAIIGVILGIVDIVKKKKNGGKKGLAIAGLILSIIAVIVIALWVFVFGALMAVDYTTGQNGLIEKAKSGSESYRDTTAIEQQLLDEYFYDYYDNYYDNY